MKLETQERDHDRINKTKVPPWYIIWCVLLFSSFVAAVIYSIVDDIKDDKARKEYCENVTLKIEGNIFEMRLSDKNFCLIGIEPTEFVYQEKKPQSMHVYAGVLSQDKTKMYVLAWLNDDIVEKLPYRRKVEFGPDDEKSSIHIDLDSIKIDGVYAGSLRVGDAGLFDGMPRKIDNKPVTKS